MHSVLAAIIFFSIFRVTLWHIFKVPSSFKKRRGVGWGMKQAVSLKLLYLFSYRDNVFDILIQQQVNVHHMLYGSLFGHIFNSSTFCDPFILWWRYVGLIKRVVMRWWIIRLKVKILASLQLEVYFFPLWLNYKVLHELLFTIYGQN